MNKFEKLLDTIEHGDFTAAEAVDMIRDFKQSENKKLKEISDLVNYLHEDASSELEELDNREEMLYTEDMEDIRAYEAVVNVTSQIKEILTN